MAVEQESSRLYGEHLHDRSIGERFVSGHWPVAVYGLGKMGLPLAAVFAEVTGAVIGADIDAGVVRRINRGEAPVRGEPGLDSLVADVVDEGRLSATTDASAAAADASIHLIIVPTTLRDDRGPDLANLRDAARSIGSGVDAGDLVLVESTVPPHTCRDVVRPIIAAVGGIGADEFGVAYCPERTASGRALADIRGAYPKIVGGVNPESTRIASRIYREITSNEVIPVSDATTAECVKLFEGIYRDVNIALANELATFADDLGVDVIAAIDAANTQPFCDIHAPGPGVGGHCIPFYPWFLIEGRSERTRLLRAARAVNERMPTFTVEKCLELLTSRATPASTATALLLGVAYRPGVAEARTSPALDIAAGLTKHGVSTFAVDPVLDTLPRMDAVPVSLGTVDRLDPDLILVVTPHEEFHTIDWSAFDRPIVVDCHDALDPETVPHDVYTIGGGTHVQ